MKLDWQHIERDLQFEESLFKATRDCVHEFGKSNNSEETFYTFAFDTEIQQNHFGLCLNSLEYYESQLKVWEQKSRTFNYDDKLQLKFNPGDWKYQAFNKFDFPAIKNIWDLVVGEKIDSINRIFEEIEFSKSLSQDEIDETYNFLLSEFTNSVEKVIRRIKQENIFTNLNITNDFKIYYIEFSEDASEIINRINE
jgi:hypothetical protein